MNLFEALKKPFFKQKNIQKEIKQQSSVPEPQRVDLDNLEDYNLGFFDGYTDFNTQFYGDLGYLERSLTIQKNWIKNYRRIAKIPEVANAIGEVVDEALFSDSGETCFSLEISSDLPKAIEQKIRTEFDTILRLLNLKRNLYFLFERFYIDGQLILQCVYNNKNSYQKEVITQIRVLNPMNFYYNKQTNKWIYKDVLEGDDNNLLFSNFANTAADLYDREFFPEEIVRIDSTLYEGRVILSDLHPAIKVANNLQTLEEMLVPMRFSRSVSRRVFNIDVANLNSKKAEEYIQQIQQKFKYKKFYDLESGQIANQQHIASLTEDYWFPNRSGAKGTSVETIDETGNLGETGDLDYFRKKLYAALKVPLTRLGIDDKAEFDFTSTNVSREELKFFNFICRKRQQFAELFLELLKRQLVAKKVMTEKEFSENKENITIKWLNENKFYERMKDEQLTQAITMFRDYEELAQKGWISKEFLYKRVLKFSQEQIEEIQKEIEKEKTDKLYKNIKAGEDLGDMDGGGGFDNAENDEDDADDNVDDTDDNSDNDSDNDDESNSVEKDDTDADNEKE